jgi:hypothetical protein
MTTTDSTPAGRAGSEQREMPRLKARYRSEIKPALTEQFATPTPCRSRAWSRSS